MPNGFHGSKEEWERATQPLYRIDEPLSEFAKAEGIEVSRNARNWPERSLRWTDGGIDKLIQVYLEDEKDLTYSLWVCASQDRARRRFSKKKTLAKSVGISDISDAIRTHLENARGLLGSWTADDLEDAVELTEIGITNGIMTMSDCPTFRAKVLAGPRALRILHRIIRFFVGSGKGQ